MTFDRYSKTSPTIILERNQPTAVVFNIQFNSTEDGPGIRTSVFLKGCSMTCPWCHNPEGLRRSLELVWYEARCIGAKDCVDACPQNALLLTSEGIKIDRDCCDVCGQCVTACPASALDLTGKRYTVDELLRKAVQDRVFYQKSGGGVTLSGGEVSLQADFVVPFIKALKKEGIHVALDTCGGAKWEKLERLVSLSDLVLYDIKTMDSDDHFRYTGIRLESILTNAQNIARMGKPMWIRTPIIPRHTNSENNIKQIAGFIRDKLHTVQRYDLIAFNSTCSSKYHRLGLVWDLEDEALISEERMEYLARAARDEGLDFVRWSGITKQNSHH